MSFYFHCYTRNVPSFVEFLKNIFIHGVDFFDWKPPGGVLERVCCLYVQIFDRIGQSQSGTKKHACSIRFTTMLL